MVKRLSTINIALIVIVVMVFIGIGVLIYSLSNPNLTGNIINDNTVQSKQTIKIAALLPLSGPRSYAGEYCTQGLTIGSENISSGKYVLDILYEDTKYETKTAVDAIHKVIAIDEVHYIIGPYASPEVLAVGPIAEKSRIVLITPSAQATEISALGDYIFRTQITVHNEAPFWARFLNNITQNLSVIAMDSDYSPSYMKEFSKYYAGKIFSLQKFQVTDIDYKTILLKIKNEGTSNILLLAGSRNAAYIVKQANELNMHVKFYGVSPIEGQEFLDIAGESADGLFYPYPYDVNSDASSMKDYKDKYLDRYNTTPEMYSANCYDALMILHDCIEKVGDVTEKVKDCLYTVKDYPGASGILSMDSNGDVIKPLIIKTVKDEKFVKYEQ